jgi:hypothetical protein
MKGNRRHVIHFHPKIHSSLRGRHRHRSTKYGMKVYTECSGSAYDKIRGFFNEFAIFGFYKSRKILDHLYNYINLRSIFVCYELVTMLMLNDVLSNKIFWDWGQWQDVLNTPTFEWPTLFSVATILHKSPDNGESPDMTLGPRFCWISSPLVLQDGYILRRCWTVPNGDAFCMSSFLK